MNVYMDINEYSAHIDADKTIEIFGVPSKRESNIILKCKCGDTWQSSCRKFLITYKKYARVLCQSCRCSEKWNDSEYRGKMVTVSHTEEAKKPRSQKIKQNYVDNPKLKKTLSAKSSAMWNREGFRESASACATEIMANLSEEERARRALSQQIAQSGLEYRRNQSQKMKLIWEDESYLENQKTKQSESSLVKWQDPEYREKQAAKKAAFLKSGRDTSIERTTQTLLDVIGVTWERQHKIGFYSFDLFVPNHGLLIECQGEYHHSHDHAKKNDASKHTYISEFFPQYRILYLYETEFLNPDLVKHKLIKEIFQTGHSINQVEYDFKSVSIKRMDTRSKVADSYYSAPEEFLHAFHYAGYGRSSKILYGAFLGEKLIAVCKFAQIVRNEVATSMNLDHTEVLELDRLCINPQYQKKNFASWFISRASRLAFDEFPKVSVLVSFADSTYGHSGTIYKASNWTEVVKVKPDYYYINKERFIIKKKKLWRIACSLKKTEREYAEEHGYIKIYGKEKTKFILKRP